MNIPQEDIDDASWEGAPVTNARNIATESVQETTVIEKVWVALYLGQGCLRSRDGEGKNRFLEPREKSETFILSQEKFNKADLIPLKAGINI